MNSITVEFKDGSRKEVKTGDYIEYRNITTAIAKVTDFSSDQFSYLVNIRYLLPDLSLADEERKIYPKYITKIISEDEIIQMWISKNEAIIKNSLEKIKHLHKKIKDSRKNIRTFKKQLAETHSEKGQSTL